MKHDLYLLLLLPAFLFAQGCNQTNRETPSKEAISQLSLKRGALISCSPTSDGFGNVSFNMNCDEKEGADFNLAIALLHSFEYDEAEKMFAKVIDKSPDCAMAYWGVAMSNFHALWTPPTEAELIKGSRAVALAKNIKGTSEREAAYINAITSYYDNWEKLSHLQRCENYEKAMENVYTSFPEDKEAAIFYALALVAAADPTDKTYQKQKKAGAILQGIYPTEPNHPGVIHYIIHTYDYPGLAQQALSAARQYALVAPASAHALHMPSHIFTRLGLWDECIRSNKQSVAAAQCYAAQAGIKGHWDEELHGLDYLVYGYLQKGEDAMADAQLAYLDTMSLVEPVNFKVAYAFAAIPGRIALEKKDWNRAAGLHLHPLVPWQKFPWPEAIVHFTKLLGAAQLGNLNAANAEFTRLQQLHDTLLAQKDSYKATQVAIQIKTGEAWMKFAAGKQQVALQLMKDAAAMEDATGKHPVTPGEVLPARELLADMLLAMHEDQQALAAYEAVLQKSPNRYNSLNGAAVAAAKTGDQQKAAGYQQQLVSTANAGLSLRPAIAVLRKKY